MNRVEATRDNLALIHGAIDEAHMLKVLMVVILLIVAALVAGAYFHINPAIAIFLILGGGLYMVTRIGGPALPRGSDVWGATDGVPVGGRDFTPADDSHSGRHLRDDVDPSDLERGRLGGRAPRPMPAIRVEVKSRSGDEAPS